VSPSIVKGVDDDEQRQYRLSSKMMYQKSARKR